MVFIRGFLLGVSIANVETETACKTNTEEHLFSPISHLFLRHSTDIATVLLYPQHNASKSNGDNDTKPHHVQAPVHVPFSPSGNRCKQC